MSSQHRKLPWGLLLISALIISFFIDFLFLNIVIPKQLQIDLTHQLGTPSLSRINGSELARFERQKNYPPPDTSTTFSIQRNIKDCFPNIDLSNQSLQTLHDLKAFIYAAEGAVQSEQLELENFNFIGPDQSEHRIQVLPSDQNQGENLEIRYFTLDSEGFPVRTKTPSSLTTQNYSEFLINRKLLLHQKRFITQFTNGASVLIEEINGQEQDILWRSPNGSFACSKEVCRCLSSGTPVDELDDKLAL